VIAEGLLLRAAAVVPVGGRPVVAVDGVDGAGKTTFADALALLLQERGQAVVRASIDGFHHVLAHRRAQGRTPEAVWRRHFDYETLRRELLGPWRSGPSARYRTAVHDVTTDATLDRPALAVPAEGVLLVDGLFCQRAELAGCWDRVIFLDVPFQVSVRRLAARDGSAPDVEDPDQRRYIAAQLLYFAACDPRTRADLVLTP
jgi:uridine kinase